MQTVTYIVDMPKMGQFISIDLVDDRYNVNEIENYNPTDSILIRN